MWLQPLTQEDPTYHRTTKPSTATMELQPLKPEPRSLCSTTGEATAGRAHTLQPERSPRPPQPERGGPLLPTDRERSPAPHSQGERSPAPHSQGERSPAPHSQGERGPCSPQPGRSPAPHSQGGAPVPPQPEREEPLTLHSHRGAPALHS